MSRCPFCEIATESLVARNAAAIAFSDRFPVTEGHTLVVPLAHVVSIFDLSADELAALWQLVAEVRAALAQQHRPDAFNIGVNDGQAVGQTVMHAHVHVIPRYAGDAADLRGGIRAIIPEKARYW